MSKLVGNVASVHWVGKTLVNRGYLLRDGKGERGGMTLWVGMMEGR
jgi:hypothetical protein